WRQLSSAPPSASRRRGVRRLRRHELRPARGRPARGGEDPVRRLSQPNRADPAVLPGSRHSAHRRRHGRDRRGSSADRESHSVRLADRRFRSIIISAGWRRSSSSDILAPGLESSLGNGMIEPYTAVGLIPSFWGIRRREDMAKNLEHIESLTHAAFWLSNLDIPVRLIAIPEGALQGFNDEVLDLDHVEFARNCAIAIPGPDTDRLGRLARQWGVFIMAQAKA